MRNQKATTIKRKNPPLTQRERSILRQGVHIRKVEFDSVFKRSCRRITDFLLGWQGDNLYGISVWAVDLVIKNSDTQVSGNMRFIYSDFSGRFYTTQDFSRLTEIVAAEKRNFKIVTEEDRIAETEAKRKSDTEKEKAA